MDAIDKAGEASEHAESAASWINDIEEQREADDQQYNDLAWDVAFRKQEARPFLKQPA